MIFWRPRTTVLITERRFADLRLIKRAVCKGIGWWRRVKMIIHRDTLRDCLDDALRAAASPRRVLLIAHGSRGRLVAAREAGTDRYVDPKWWGSFDSEVEIFALGCETALFVPTYELSQRVGRFVAFREKVRFYVGSDLGKATLNRVCADVGDLFLRAPTLDKVFTEELRAKYEEAILAVSRSSGDHARRYILIELERQLESLECSGAS